MKIIGARKKEKKTEIPLKEIPPVSGGTVAAVLLCAGQGSRAGGENKLIRTIKGKSAIYRSLELFLSLDIIENIVLVISESTASHASRTIKALRAEKRCILVEGAKTRGESANEGLKALAEMETPPDIVAIHDAARCLLRIETLEACLQTARAKGSAVAAIPAVDTIRRVAENSVIVDELNRDELLQIQTPQVFAFDLIKDCYKNAVKKRQLASDDATLLFRNGYEVHTVRGTADNIKITHPEDFALAEFLIEQRGEQLKPLKSLNSIEKSIEKDIEKGSDSEKINQIPFRIGLGEDTHRFVVGRKLIIGGVDIPFERGLAGHSDADVLAHAVSDALLGAAALGDIGKLFPDNDMRYKDADSIELLREVNSALKQRKYSVINVDAVITAEAPKMAPYIDLMCKNIAMALNISDESVSVKATTSEGLGYTGRSEGIAARAVVLIAND